MKKDKRLTNPQPPPQLNINLENMPIVKCPGCKRVIFEQGMVGRYLSGLVNPQSSKANYAFQNIIICKRCGEVLPNPNKYVVEPTSEKGEENGRDD